LGNVICTLYPFLKAELFMKWDVSELNQPIQAYTDAMVQAGLISSDNQGIYIAQRQIQKPTTSWC